MGLANNQRVHRLQSVPPLLINAVIRARRADAEATRLTTDISSSTVRIAGIREARILVSLQARPTGFAVEGGRVLPEPGDEDDWLDEAKS
jgi:hypothetical protein